MRDAALRIERAAEREREREREPRFIFRLRCLLAIFYILLLENNYFAKQIKIYLNSLKLFLF
jgi:hypothetical protein